jgi:hypothetical protein
MIDDYLKLLEYLEEWGIDRLVEVDHLLYDWFKNQPNVEPNEHLDSIGDRIVHFVDEMHESRHIRLSKKKKNEDGTGPWYVSARLTSGGLEYLNNYRLVQSTLNLNASTIESNGVVSGNSRRQTTIFRRQTLILGIVGVFALVSMTVSIMTYILDNNTKQLSGEIEQLKQDNLKLKKEILLQLTHHTKTN